MQGKKILQRDGIIWKKYLRLKCSKVELSDNLIRQIYLHLVYHYFLTIVEILGATI